jgi:hypothetical protein
METKSPLKSKTLWFNALAAAVSALTGALAADPAVQASGTAGAVIAAINFGLRFFTNKRLS